MAETSSAPAFPAELPEEVAREIMSKSPDRHHPVDLPMSLGGEIVAYRTCANTIFVAKKGANLASVQYNALGQRLGFFSEGDAA